jgi:LPPG:FO 2-phospho-L-lactate transferase
MTDNVVALAGGVGGAKLADGLASRLDPDHLTIIVNTGDDFEHIGLVICPDVDTVCYTLAGIANPETGWGRANETWYAFETLEKLGGPTWFKLGDQDLGLHLERTRRLRLGDSLSRVVSEFCRAWGVGWRVIPMTNDPMPTWVNTDEGELPFQEYFVHRQCRPVVKGFMFAGAEQAKPAPGVLEALRDAGLVVICPSNPWVSVGPILAVPGIRKALESAQAPVIAVSPIIGGKAVKGPAAKMYTEMGIQPAALSVARHYGRLISGFVMDRVDAHQEPVVRELGVETLLADTLMKTQEDRSRLADEVLQFGAALRRSRRGN